MKKLLTVSLTLILALTLSISAFATGGFISSPTGNPAPEVEKVEKDEDCFADIIVTPFADRNDLSEEKKALIEKAYKAIKDNSNLAALLPALKDVAEKAGIKPENLAVSDLFDISYHEDGDHGEHGAFTITLKSDALENFVALMCLTDEGWKLVDAKLDETGKLLTLTEADLFAYAIVVDATSENQPTGEIGVWVYLAGMVVSLAAICVILKVQRKKENA